MLSQIANPITALIAAITVNIKRVIFRYLFMALSFLEIHGDIVFGFIYYIDQTGKIDQSQDYPNQVVKDHF